MTLLRCTISMSYCYLLMDMGLLLFGSSMMKLSSVFSFVKLGKRSGRLHYGDTYKWELLSQETQEDQFYSLASDSRTTYFTGLGPTSHHLNPPTDFSLSLPSCSFVCCTIYVGMLILPAVWFQFNTFNMLQIIVPHHFIQHPTMKWYFICSYSSITFTCCMYNVSFRVATKTLGQF